MISQKDFMIPVSKDLMEEENPQISVQQGGFKTRNPKTDPRQRRFIHVSDTKFNRTIEMVTCLHGWDTPQKNKAMTLIVVRFHLSCSTRNRRYKSVTLGFKFGEKNLLNVSTKSKPTVIAYAPFVETARFGETDVARTIRQKLEGTLGVNQIATAEARAGFEREEAYNRKYFNEGTANPIINEETNEMIGVKWYLEQNAKQNDGVTPDFRIAVLLQRAVHQDGSQPQFIGTLDLETEAGLLEDFRQGARRVFGLPEDDDVIFDPTLPGQAYGTIGEALLKAVEQYKDNMAVLADDEQLAGLCSVYGLHPITPS
ncbi:hypothetical protein V8E54_012367 [Elaphomyces granulatus]|jgi:hypothetical protein